MSKQRKKHPKIVERRKYIRSIKKGLSVPSNFREYVRLNRRWLQISKYQGTEFRGQKRWNR